MNEFPNAVRRAMNESYSVNIEKYVNDGFRIIQKDFGMFLGFFLVTILIAMGASFIPIVGSLANSLILSPCLTAGFYLAAQAADEDRPFEFGLFFKGFDKMKPLVIMTLIQTGIAILIFVPIGAIFYLFVDGFDPVAANPENAWLIILFAFLIAIPIIYIFISWSFAPLLIVFHNMDAWPAMQASQKIVGKKWLYFLLLYFVSSLIAMAGVILICVGVLFTVPAAMAMIFAAFKDIVGLGDEEDNDLMDHLLI